MTKIVLAVLMMTAIAAPALAGGGCFKDQMTVQSQPVLTTDAAGTAPVTPVPSPVTTKTGG